MSVSISIYGADIESDEYQAAVKLKKIISESLGPKVVGEIVLFSNATLMGQTVKDVDLIMIGRLQNYSVNAEFSVGEEGFIRDEVEINSFCTTIEIKRHDISGIMLNGTDFYVKYGKSKHCVTLQSNNQKISAMNFFKRTISYSPFITNVIWFTQATQEDLTELSIGESGQKMISNVIGSNFSFEELMQLLIYQRKPIKIGNVYSFESNNECSVDDIQRALMLFSTTKKNIGKLTRHRIEQISSKAFRNTTSWIESNGKVSIYRGRAGTGKTVGLIQTAIRLVDEEQARVVILTYNKALVSDIRRLFALAELPDMFEAQCVHISTMHSYFYRLSNHILYDNKLNGDKYLQNYDSVMKELNSFLSDGDSVELVREMCKEIPLLDWDYVLIDEAQDWNNTERDIILNLFDQGKIIVADGGQQFVRNIDVCDWSVVRNRNNIKLKYCLRQKENLVKFLNVFTEKNHILGGKILTHNEMPGGKILIVCENELMKTIKNQLRSLKDSGNTAYDFLILVPPSLVKKHNGENTFCLKESFINEGLFVWDGTREKSRDEYSIDMEEMRVLQYDSARGLEGWTVACLDFDAFIENKSNSYIEGEVDSLLLETPEERKRKYLYNWAMIPLTRAIDTLIITLKDKNSATGKILKEISNEYPDFVYWIE